eukprot:GEZU01021615.1.p1 GENE.GEZU01021615.1~~GEZU01021615.1.p1  ORF type:complete len:238 (-),score=83.31 GEZU01021615.1:207-920(-)
MFEQGVNLREIRVIPDDIDIIANTAKEFSEAYTYVFTSGGIGPTHDDKTYEALAKAFSNSEMYFDQKVLDKMLASMMAKNPAITHLNDARRRMALFPKGCETLEIEGLWVPIVVVNRNVHVLPGIPELFQRMLLAHKDRFVSVTVPKTRMLVFTNMLEGDIADVLTDAQRAFPDVAIGSYPVLDSKAKERGYKVKISIEGENADHVRQVYETISPAVEGFVPEDIEKATTVVTQQAI